MFNLQCFLLTSPPGFKILGYKFNDDYFSHTTGFAKRFMAQPIIGLLQTQAKLIQEQAEKIRAFKQTVPDLKDEIVRLTNTHKTA